MEFTHAQQMTEKAAACDAENKTEPSIETNKQRHTQNMCAAEEHTSTDRRKHTYDTG